MRNARRNQIVSAAQVAFYFGGYTFDSAMDLSSSERDLLLSVAVAERERGYDRLERVLGVTFDTEDLVRIVTGEAKGNDDGAVPHAVQIPMLLALAPEYFGEIAKKYAKRSSGKVGKPTSSVDLGTLSKAEAQSLFKMAASQSPTSDT